MGDHGKVLNYFPIALLKHHGQKQGIEERLSWDLRFQMDKQVKHGKAAGMAAEVAAGSWKITTSLTNRKQREQIRSEGRLGTPQPLEAFLSGYVSSIEATLPP